MNSYLGIFLAVLGVVAIIASAIAVFRASYSRSIIETQKETIDSQSVRMDEYEATERRNTLRIQELEATVEQQKVQISTLTELATGKAAVERLVDLFSQHDNSVHAKLDLIVANQKQALRLLGSGREDDR